MPPAAFPAVDVEVEPGVVGIVVELETPEALCWEDVRERKAAAEEVGGEVAAPPS